MKRILFLTGTRADFGKLKPLMMAVEKDPNFESTIFVTGMHTLKRYGSTSFEVQRAGFAHIHVYHNQASGEAMDLVLANTITGLSRYIQENPQDLVIVHGDRVEPLAGAIVGALNNTLVAHVEGGEVSGTIDELIRHSVSKLSHIHFVSNEEARERLIQMGENPESIFVIGSPDFDVMISPDLPTIEQTRERYNITFPKYGILLFHPVTTELDAFEINTEALITAIEGSDIPYVVIFPNNDAGNDIIIRHYERAFRDKERFITFPSIRFEHFLTLLKNASFILGNSSAGVREAPFYNVPAINVGSRQNKRYTGEGVIDVPFNPGQILAAIQKVLSKPQKASQSGSNYWGKGQSANYFMECLKSDSFWQTSHQKTFRDIL